MGCVRRIFACQDLTLHYCTFDMFMYVSVEPKADALIL